MSKIDQAIINFKVYEDGSEYMGMASATLPDLTFLSQTISGAGIGGNIEAPVLGHMDAMTLSLAFRTLTEHSYKLTAPKVHHIDLRVAQQVEDNETGQLKAVAVKHVLVVVPKTLKGGNVAPAASADASGEYAVRYWATYIDGEKVLELDPMNFICFVSDTDYLTTVRKALGA